VDFRINSVNDDALRPKEEHFWGKAILKKYLLDKKK